MYQYCLNMPKVSTEIIKLFGTGQSPLGRNWACWARAAMESSTADSKIRESRTTSVLPLRPAQNPPRSSGRAEWVLSNYLTWVKEWTKLMSPSTVRISHMTKTQRQAEEAIQCPFHLWAPHRRTGMVKPFLISFKVTGLIWFTSLPITPRYFWVSIMNSEAVDQRRNSLQIRRHEFDF